MTFRLRKTPVPGKCRVAYCRKPPRDLRHRPRSTQLCGSHAKEQWRLDNPTHAAFDNLRASARKRKIPFDLTLEEFLLLVEATRYVDDKGKQRHCLHIDRIDVAIGYTLDNLQVLTCGDNVAKGNAERRQRFVDEKINGKRVLVEGPF